MYVCKVIGKVISTVKNEKLIGHSIVLVRTTALAPDGTFVPGDQVRLQAHRFQWEDESLEVLLQSSWPG